MAKVSIITLGCPKNIVEGENIAGLIKESGFDLMPDLKDADIAVVHTCSFISDADRESADVIKRLSQLRQSGRLKKLFVTGCLVQKEGKNIIAKFPDVDSFVGTGNLHRLPEIIDSNEKLVLGKPGGYLEGTSKRLLSSALPSAYLRIAEGCSHRCSFCIIPKLRGRYKSRNMKSIVREAEELAGQGIREFNLIAQDTSIYGRDLYGYSALPELIRKLAQIPAVKWIRILYAYPATITRELLETIKNEEKVCKYLDIPLQHVNERILRKMGRPSGARKVVERIRKDIPGITLRTTLIVGFPGETKKEFGELYNFVGDGWIDHLGVFEYSQNKGASSHKFSGQINKQTAGERKKRLMLKQREIVKIKNKARVNSNFEVLVESSNVNKIKSGMEFRKYAISSGRSEFQAPEIDNLIYLSGKQDTGSFVNVKITGIRGYDLMGEVVSKAS